MNHTSRARERRGPLRTTALTAAALLSGAVLLAGCSQGGSASSASPAGIPNGAARPQSLPAAGSGAAGPAAAGGTGADGGSPAAPKAARLALATQSIIYTASLTIQARNVMAAANQATAIVTAQGGYVSSEQTSVNPATRVRPTVSLQLKVPVSAYPATLGRLSGGALGTETSLSQQAQDVTGQVADVTSQVTSAQVAITQLQALLRRAGSISDLLTVQDQISTQESSLEALQAQQRALARETSYATVSVTLLGPQPRRPSVKERKRQQHGFVAGLDAGWRGMRLVASAAATVLGAVLPFAVLAAVLAGAGYAVLRRRLRRLRGGSRPTAAG
jgi:hypothetical protein